MGRHVLGTVALTLLVGTVVPLSPAAGGAPVRVDAAAPAALCTSAWPAPFRDVSGYRRVRVGCTTTWTIEGRAARSTTARAILAARLDGLRTDVYDTTGDTTCSTGRSIRYCTRTIRLRGHPGVRGRITVSHDGLHGWSKTRVDVFRVT